MAKRNNGTKRTNGGTTTTKASDATTADAMEQRVLAFGEQLGRIAGTIQAKAEGWMDRETLNKQIASVRDGAADLLEQLAGGATKRSTRVPTAAAAHGNTKGRSGGVVDAPGKKHRKPMPPDPELTPRQVRDVLSSTATDLGPSGRDDSFGAGLLDASAAVQAAVDLAPVPVQSTSALCANATRDPFTDNPPGPHQSDIVCLAAANVTTGKTASTYDPSAAVTRGQMATFVARALDAGYELLMSPEYERLTEPRCTGEGQCPDDGS